MAECKRINIAEDVCYIGFGERPRPHHSDEIGSTRRGELIIANYDEDGKVVGLELVGAEKPCQR